jgi:hypothetical protein
MRISDTRELCDFVLKHTEERMMGQLERRAEAISGEFNSQAVANTLWVFATMGTTAGGG